MTIRSTATASPDQGLQGNNERLDSWKEIACYLRREVRTVQLWEKKEGLPVHRHFHKRLGSVYALRSEVDRWRQQVCQKAGGQNSAATNPPEARTRIAVFVSPLEAASLPARQQIWRESIVAATVGALEQLDPDRLVILHSVDPAPHESGTASAETAKQNTPDYILRWSIQIDGSAVQLDANLVTGGAENVWSLRHRRDARDLAGLPAYVADQIVQCLWLRVFCPPASFPAIRSQEKRSAREAYLKGRYFWTRRSEQSLRKAVQCFESAIREDPQFALPYSGLADSLTLLSFYEIVSPAEAMPSARRAAVKAIELDPGLAEGHASLADVLLHFDRDWQGADHEYRRSIQCNPAYGLGYHWYSNLLAARGRHEAAYLAIMHALEIDPVSIINQVWAGVTSHMAHRFEQAIEHYRSALELDPQFVWAHMYMAQALEQTGDFKQALREFEKTIQLAGGSNCVKAMKAHAYAAAGDKSSARQILRELKNALPRQCTPSYDIAAVHAALGESTRMIAWLDRACQERNMKLFTLNQDPRFDAFRQCSEFREIVERTGLTESSPVRAEIRPS